MEPAGLFRRMRHVFDDWADPLDRRTEVVVEAKRVDDQEYGEVDVRVGDLVTPRQARRLRLRTESVA